MTEDVLKLSASRAYVAELGREFNTVRKTMDGKMELKQMKEAYEKLNVAFLAANKSEI